MDTMAAWARGEASKSEPRRVFDWNKAVEIIKANGYKNASAGLHSDLEWTCGAILRDGKPVPEDDTYTYLASTWATPVLVLRDGTEIDCWSYEADVPGWDANTYWPESALELLSE